MKKAQGISMNVIIIAAIALIVMIVLIAIFTGRIGKFQQEAAAGEERAKEQICATQGTCAASCGEGFREISGPAGGWIDCTDVCCEPDE